MENRRSLDELEDWQLDFEWLRTRHFVKDTLGLEKMPDLRGILFLIGVQELGQVRDEFSKEEKQDLMHIAVCRLLSYDGYYELVGYDDEGWPHWKQLAAPEAKGVKHQERLLQLRVIEYFGYLQSNEMDN